MELNEAYDILRQRYKTHTAVAYHLGITPPHYGMLRRGQANMSRKTANLILLAAKNCTPSASAEAVPNA